MKSYRYSLYTIIFTMFISIIFFSLSLIPFIFKDDKEARELIYASIILIIIGIIILLLVFTTRIVITEKTLNSVTLFNWEKKIKYEDIVRIDKFLIGTSINYLSKNKTVETFLPLLKMQNQYDLFYNILLKNPRCIVHPKIEKKILKKCGDWRPWYSESK